MTLSVCRNLEQVRGDSMQKARRNDAPGGHQKANGQRQSSGGTSRHPTPRIYLGAFKRSEFQPDLFIVRLPHVRDLKTVGLQRLYDGLALYSLQTKGDDSILRLLTPERPQ